MGEINIKAAWHCSQCRREGEKEITDLLAKAANEARLEALEQAAQAFQEEYCKHDSPLLGVARGVEAIRALKAAPLDPQRGQHEN